MLIVGLEPGALPRVCRVNWRCEETDLNTTFSFKKDQEICSQGKPATYLYQVVNGAIRLLDNHNGTRQIVSFQFPGDVFGLELARPHYRWTAEAVVEGTTVRRARRLPLLRKARSNLLLSSGLLSLATRELMRAEDYGVVRGLAATARVAAFVLEMNERIGAGGVIELPMNRADVGDHLALSLETVVRGLSRLGHKGLLKRDGDQNRERRLVLSRPERLREMLPSLATLELRPLKDNAINKIFR